MSALLGILALGNAPLVDGGAEKSRCVWLAEAAARLGVPSLREPLWEATPPDGFGSALASAGVGRSLEPKLLRSAAQAAAARDVLISQLHAELFYFVCRRANDALAPATTPGGGALGAAGRVVSVFDFAGGEAGEANGAQQLLHNYSQERLHALCVGALVVDEQVRYAREGLQWAPLTVAGNAAVIAVLDAALQPTAVSPGAAADVVGAFGLGKRGGGFGAPTKGLLALLDGAARRAAEAPEASERGEPEAALALCEEVERAHGPSGCVARAVSRGGAGAPDVAFVVKHTTGPVVYDAAELLRGARPAALPRPFKALLASSSNVLLKQLGDHLLAQATAPNTPAGSRPSSFKGERRRSWGDAAGAALAARRRTSVLAAGGGGFGAVVVRRPARRRARRARGGARAVGALLHAECAAAATHV